MERPNIWADNADGGDALRKREERAAARVSEDYRIRTEGMAGIDPATPTPEQVIAAERLMDGTELELAPDFVTTKPNMDDRDPTAATPAQIKVAETYIGETKLELAPEVEIAKPDKYDTDPTAATPNQMLGAEAILKSRGSDIKLSPIAEEHDPFNKTGANFIPKIQVKPEVKPWHQPASEKSFFRKLFGG